MGDPLRFRGIKTIFSRKDWGEGYKSFFLWKKKWLSSDGYSALSEFKAQLVLTGPHSAISPCGGFLVRLFIPGTRKKGWEVLRLHWDSEVKDPSIYNRPMTRTIVTQRGRIHVTCAVLDDAVQAPVRVPLRLPGEPRSTPASSASDQGCASSSASRQVRPLVFPCFERQEGVAPALTLADPQACLQRRLLPWFLTAPSPCPPPLLRSSREDDECSTGAPFSLLRSTSSPTTCIQDPAASTSVGAPPGQQRPAPVLATSCVAVDHQPQAHARQPCPSFCSSTSPLSHPTPSLCLPTEFVCCHGCLLELQFASRSPGTDAPRPDPSSSASLHRVPRRSELVPKPSSPASPAAVSVLQKREQQRSPGSVLNVDRASAACPIALPPLRSACQARNRSMHQAQLGHFLPLGPARPPAGLSLPPNRAKPKGEQTPAPLLCFFSYCWAKQIQPVCIFFPDLRF